MFLYRIVRDDNTSAMIDIALYARGKAADLERALGAGITTDMLYLSDKGLRSGGILADPRNMVLFTQDDRQILWVITRSAITDEGTVRIPAVSLVKSF